MQFHDILLVNTVLFLQYTVYHYSTHIHQSLQTNAVLICIVGVRILEDRSSTGDFGSFWID